MVGRFQFHTTDVLKSWGLCGKIATYYRRTMAWVWAHLSCKQSMIYILFIYTLLLILVLLYYVNHKQSEPNHDENFKAKVQASFLKFVEENMPKRDGKKDTRAVYYMRTMSTNGTLINNEHARILKQRAKEIQNEYIGFKSKKPFNFHCDKCAVVSSSGQLLHSKVGAEIDNATCVIRMNNAPTINFEKDVGARTDIRIVCFRSIDFMNKDTLMVGKAQFDKMVIWGMENPKHKKIKDNFMKRFSKKYPEPEYYSLSNAGEQKVTKLYEEYLGMDSWLSTGWFTMLFAIQMCDSITVYGMPDGDACSEGSKKGILYHYYEKRFDECWMYNQHETRMKTGHRYLTEKAVFKQWAQMFNITFKAPSWNLAKVNASQPIESPFIKKMEKLGKHRIKRPTIRPNPCDDSSCEKNSVVVKYSVPEANAKDLVSEAKANAKDLVSKTKDLGICAGKVECRGYRLRAFPCDDSSCEKETTYVDNFDFLVPEAKANDLLSGAKAKDVMYKSKDLGAREAKVEDQELRLMVRKYPCDDSSCEKYD